MGASFNGGPKWSVLVEKPMVFGYHHFRNPPKYLSRRYFFFPFIQWHLLSAFFSMLRHSLGLQEGILRTRRCSLDESYPKCTCFFMSGYLHQIWSRHLLIHFFFSWSTGMAVDMVLYAKKARSKGALAWRALFMATGWDVGDVFHTRYPNRWQEHHFVPAISVALRGTSLENPKKSSKVNPSQQFVIHVSIWSPKKSIAWGLLKSQKLPISVNIKKAKVGSIAAPVYTESVLVQRSTWRLGICKLSSSPRA